MDEVVEDKKKFDAENTHEDDLLPDPDERLMLDSGQGRAWSIKVPKFLMERWASVNEENKHLATLRVYNNAKPNGQARIFMFLPPNIDPSSSSLPPSGAPPHNPTRPYFAEFTKFQTIGPEPDVYELDMVNDHVENQIVVAERPKDNSFNISDDPQPKNQPVNSRARTTILTGRILHECSMRPGFSANYRKQMRKRHELYNTKTRTVKRIEQAGISGGRGGINMLTSGVGVHSGGTFGDLVKTRQKPQKGQFERMARMPRNQLLDLLFQLFRDMPMWTLRNLREKTQQPEAYLKEVLSEVAMLHRSGEHNGHWELKENFKEEGIKDENGTGSSMPAGELIKMDPDADMGDDSEEEEEDDDMEEVS